MDLNFYFFHGFLGLPSDWSQIIQALKNKTKWSRAHFVPISIWDFIPQKLSKEEDAFAQFVVDFQQYFLQQQDKAVSCANFFIGYSLGGRLLQHLLLSKAVPIDQAFLLSSHPGMPQIDQEQRKSRWQQDDNWAHRFLTEPWTVLMQDWSQQAVFQSFSQHKETVRMEENFNRQKLAYALQRWSLSKQISQGDLLKNMTNIHVCLGQHDLKFQQAWLQYLSKEQIDVILEAGHRLWLDQPETVVEVIDSKLAKFY